MFCQLLFWIVNNNYNRNNQRFTHSTYQRNCSKLTSWSDMFPCKTIWLCLFNIIGASFSLYHLQCSTIILLHSKVNRNGVLEAKISGLNDFKHHLREPFQLKHLILKQVSFKKYCVLPYKKAKVIHIKNIGLKTNKHSRKRAIVCVCCWII